MNDLKEAIIRLKETITKWESNSLMAEKIHKAMRAGEIRYIAWGEDLNIDERLGAYIIWED